MSTEEPDSSFSKQLCHYALRKLIGKCETQPKQQTTNDHRQIIIYAYDYLFTTNGAI